MKLVKAQQRWLLPSYSAYVLPVVLFISKALSIRFPVRPSLMARVAFDPVFAARLCDHQFPRPVPVKLPTTAGSPIPLTGVR